jgi:hypothetical protein
MSDIPPLWYRYGGEGEFQPASDQAKSEADRHYVIGEVYRLAPNYGRSENSHRHQFASIHDAWANLPPDLHMLYPSADHLRKWALIKSGWCNSMTFVMADGAHAKTLARELRNYDEFAVVQVKDNVVIRTTAKSQSRKAMPGEAFQKSKSDCLAVIAELLGTTPEALEQNTGKSGDGKR